MEGSVGKKWKHREFALASVADMSSGSSSPGVARFSSDGLQIHHESHQIPINVDLRIAKLFKLGPVQSVCMLEEGTEGVKKTSCSRGITLLFRNEEESAAFHCVVQQWNKELNFKEEACQMELLQFLRANLMKR